MSFGLQYAFNNFCHWNRLDVPETGLAALVRLSNGDMRKALNILQVMNFFFLHKFVDAVGSVCVFGGGGGGKD